MEKPKISVIGVCAALVAQGWTEPKRPDGEQELSADFRRVISQDGRFHVSIRSRAPKVTVNLSANLPTTWGKTHIGELAGTDQALLVKRIFSAIAANGDRVYAAAAAEVQKETEYKARQEEAKAFIRGHSGTIYGKTAHLRASANGDRLEFVACMNVADAPEFVRLVSKFFLDR